MFFLSFSKPSSQILCQHKPLQEPGAEGFEFDKFQVFEELNGTESQPTPA